MGNQKIDIDFRAGTTPSQDAHWILYSREIFGAMLRIIEQPSVSASPTNRLKLIAELAHIGYSGAVAGVGLGDFDDIIDRLSDMENGGHNS